MIGRKCDKCDKKDKPVYPVYKVIASSEVELQRNPVTGELEGKTYGYLCIKCSKEDRL